MREFLQQYKIRLNTIGPVFVGNGKELIKKEYILNKRARRAVIIDQTKFLRYLIKKNMLDSYERYILGKNGTLQDWMYEERISDADLRSFTAYEYDCGNIADLKQMKNILTFIKDPYGRPYVPGSSIKGAIRTVLLGADILNNPSRYSRIADYLAQEDFSDWRERRSLKRQLEHECKRAEQIFFCTKEKSDKNQTVNDIMNGVRVSDSRPLDISDLTLCQKIDMHTDGHETDLPILRECLKPDTLIEFDMTIDSTECQLTPEQIRSSINVFLKGYNKLFLEKFADETLYKEDVIYLGGGAGLATKTVLHELLKDSKSRSKIIGNIIDLSLPQRAKSQHKHYLDGKTGVSPHVCKLTEYDGELLQMGPCSIEIV